MSTSKPTDAPLVTVIVGCFNHARFVEECLDAVRAQTYSNLEWIIFDDSSTDNSVAVIREWLRRNQVAANFIAHTKNVGVCKSLNEVIALARGKYVSMIAADDVWMPDKITMQVTLMEQLPESVGVAYSDAYRIDERGLPVAGMFIESHQKRGTPPSGAIGGELWSDNFIPAMTTLIRKKCFDEVGAYDEQLGYEDWDMWIRISARFEFAFCSQPTARYRLVATSLSHGRRDVMIDSTARMYAKWLDARLVPPAHRTKAVDTLCIYAAALYRKADPRGRHYLWKAFKYRPTVRRFLAVITCSLGIPAPTDGK